MGEQKNTDSNVVDAVCIHTTTLDDQNPLDSRNINRNGDDRSSTTGMVNSSSNASDDGAKENGNDNGNGSAGTSNENSTDGVHQILSAKTTTTTTPTICSLRISLKESADLVERRNSISSQENRGEMNMVATSLGNNITADDNDDENEDENEDDAIISNDDNEDEEEGKIKSIRAGRMSRSFESEQGPPRNIKKDKQTTNSDLELPMATAVALEDDEFQKKTTINKLDIKQVATPVYEYDPYYNSNNENKMKFLCRRYNIILGGCVILGIAVIVLVVVLSLHPKLEADSSEGRMTMNSMAPSLSPIKSTRETEILEYFARELPPGALVRGSPYAMAVDWILYDDLYLQDIDNPILNEELMLRQRFALAVVYFATTQKGSEPWRSCNPTPRSIISSEEPVVVAARQNTNTNANDVSNTTDTKYDYADAGGDTCTSLDRTVAPDGVSIEYQEIPGQIRWLSKHSECEWAGITCSEIGKVAGIELAGQKLKGNLDFRLNDNDNDNDNDDVNKIKTENEWNVLLWAFPALQAIDLNYNELTGTIPNSYAALSGMLRLRLGGNSLTGKIPPSMFENLTKLRVVQLGENKLTGTLSTQIGRLTDLQGLHLHQNNLEGGLPTEIGNLSVLSLSRIYGNEFSGPLPTEIGKLTRLVNFLYSDNAFTGTIPTQFGRLTDIDFFLLNNNQLTGTIPIELFNMKRARIIMLKYNKLTGTLPAAELLQLQELVRFEVNENRLTGPIPSQLGNLPSLIQAYLHLNQFTGDVPIDLCDAASMSFLQADCAPIDDPPNPCLCCTACCDRSTGICLPAV